MEAGDAAESSSWRATRTARQAAVPGALSSGGGASTLAEGSALCCGKKARVRSLTAAVILMAPGQRPLWRAAACQQGHPRQIALSLLQ